MTRSLLACIVLFAAVSVRAQPQDDTAAWTQTVRQVFADKCIECHVPDSTDRSAARHWADAHDLASLRAAYVLHEGQVPAEITETDLWHVLTDEPDFRMPPPDAVAGPLTDAELLVIRHWLELGAPLGESVDLTAGQAGGDQVGHAHIHGEQHDDHDHASVGVTTSTPGTLSTPRRLLRWLGKFHPPATHLPIGLLFAAGLAEAMVLWTGSVWLTEARRFCTAVAAVAAVGAATLGWFNGEFHTPSSHLTLHRWLGVTVAGLAVLVVILGELAHRQPNRRFARLGFRLLLFATVGLIGYTGHLGGELVFGEGYFQW